jgi:hypothetical protein
MANGFGTSRRRLTIQHRLLIGLAGIVVVLFAQALPYMLGHGGIDVYGQVGLLPGDFASDGAGRCSGQGRYAELRNGNKIKVTSGNTLDAPVLGDGHLVNGRCEFPFHVEVPKGQGTYVFEAQPVARWTVAEADLARRLELTVDKSSAPSQPGDTPTPTPPVIRAGGKGPSHLG